MEQTFEPSSTLERRWQPDPERPSRLIASYAIVTAEVAHTSEQLGEFVRTWDAPDRYQRFGNACASSLEWLNAAFRAGRQRGFVATQSGRIVALLDYAWSSSGVEPAILVAKAHRRHGLGRRLMHHFLALVSGGPVRAHSRLENRAAGALLRAGGFEVESQGGDEVHWVFRR